MTAVSLRYEYFSCVAVRTGSEYHLEKVYVENQMENLTKGRVSSAVEEIRSASSRIVV